MTSSILLRKWKRWFDQIQADLTQLLLNKHVFQEVQEIIRKNPSLQVPNVFYRYVADTYAITGSIGVRRLWDPSFKNPKYNKRPYRKPINLLRLLEEIKDNPSVLSRRRFIRLYKSWDQDLGRKERMRISNQDFDRAVGQGKIFVPQSKVSKDIKRIRNKTKLIKRFVDKTLAHKDPHRAKLKKLPNYKNLHDALEEMEKVLIEYRVIIFAQSAGSLTPIIQGPWKRIFRIPWIR